MLSMRKLQQLLKHEQGQSIVELALLMCFAVAVVLAVNWDGFRDIAGNAYLKMASSVGTETSTTHHVDISEYATMSTSELRQIDNAERIAIDRDTITALGRHFLGLDKSVIQTLFATTSDNLLTGKDKSKPYGVGVFDYHIVNSGDNGEALEIMLRSNGGGFVSNRQTIEWMNGNFDTNVKNYTKKNETVSTRYFFSNDAIDPSPVANVEGDQSATLRAKFTFDSEGKVESVTMNLTRSYEKTPGNWERTVCEGLSNIVITN